MPHLPGSYSFVLFSSKSFVLVTCIFILVDCFMNHGDEGIGITCFAAINKSHADVSQEVANVDGKTYLLSAKSHLCCRNISVTGIFACHRVGRGLHSHLNKKCTSFVKQREGKANRTLAVSQGQRVPPSQLFGKIATAFSQPTKTTFP